MVWPTLQCTGVTRRAQAPGDTAAAMAHAGAHTDLAMQKWKNYRPARMLHTAHKQHSSHATSASCAARVRARMHPPPAMPRPWSLGAAALWCFLATAAPVNISRPLHAPCASLRSAPPPASVHPCEAVRSPPTHRGRGHKVQQTSCQACAASAHTSAKRSTGRQNRRHQQSGIVTLLHPRPTRNEQDHKSNGRRAHAAPRGSCRQIYSESWYPGVPGVAPQPPPYTRVPYPGAPPALPPWASPCSTAPRKVC
jgi:hypothetical protein